VVGKTGQCLVEPLRPLLIAVGELGELATAQRAVGDVIEVEALTWQVS
jgi:hypothetical protein